MPVGVEVGEEQEVVGVGVGVGEELVVHSIWEHCLATHILV